MVRIEPAAELQTTATFDGTPPVAVDADFERRWAAWVARGRVHELRTRQRFLVSATVLAIGAAIAYTFLA